MSHSETEITRLRSENERLQEACSKANEEVCQTLGKALGYPWYKDYPYNFPEAAEENGVCTGDHVAESIAMEAARTIEELRSENERLRKDAERLDWCEERLMRIRQSTPEGEFLTMAVEWIDDAGVVHELHAATLRAAIDAAKEAE